jgi:hypothetical protein
MFHPIYSNILRNIILWNIPIVTLILFYRMLATRAHQINLAIGRVSFNLVICVGLPRFNPQTHRYRKYPYP